MLKKKQPQQEPERRGAGGKYLKVFIPCIHHHILDAEEACIILRNYEALNAFILRSSTSSLYAHQETTRPLLGDVPEATGQEKSQPAAAAPDAEPEQDQVLTASINALASASREAFCSSPSCSSRVFILNLTNLVVDSLVL